MRARWRGIAGVLGLVYLLSGLFFVGADQQAVVLRLGKALERPYEPGLHWSWPRPIAKVIKLRVRETKRLAVGYLMPERVLERDSQAEQAQFLTGDRNLLEIRVIVQYVIRDPVAYVVRARDMQPVLASTAEAALASVVVERQVDEVLTTGKVAIQSEVQTRCQRALDRYGCGVSILGVNIEKISPPSEVVEAFRDVASAREDRSRIIRQAESYANQTAAIARGEAMRMVTEAETYRDRLVAAADGEAMRFSSLAAEYRRAPETTASRLYLETLEEVLPRIRINIVDSGSGPVDLDLVRPEPGAQR
jgi:membrane protease subunit HflK